MARSIKASLAFGLLAAVIVAVAATTWPGSRPQSTPRPGRTAYQFLSHNTDDGLSVAEACQRLQSVEQRRFRRLAEDLLTEGGTTGHHAGDALGDWRDGAENSIFVVVPDPPDSAAIRHAAVRFGLLAGQREVITFLPDDGPDAVYQIELKETDLAALRQALDGHGIPFRTLVACVAGHRVVVYDPGRRQRGNVDRLAAAYGARVEETQGTGETIGGATRDEARHVFQQAVRTHTVEPRAVCLPNPLTPSGTILAPRKRGGLLTHP